MSSHTFRQQEGAMNYRTLFLSAAFAMTTACDRCNREEEEPAQAPTFLERVADARAEAGCLSPAEAAEFLNVGRHGSVLEGAMSGCGDEDVAVSAYAYCAGGGLRVELTPDEGTFCHVRPGSSLVFANVCVAADADGVLYLAAVSAGENDDVPLGLVQRLVPGDALQIDQTLVYEISRADGPVDPNVWPAYRVEAFAANGGPFVQNRRYGVDTEACSAE